jgi:hypothetical protein
MTDWTRVLKYPPSEITCRCGALFHTHAMFDGDVGRMVLREPCPGCGHADTIWRVSSPPERMSLGHGDTEEVS